MDKQISVEEAIKYLCMIPIPFISGNRDCDTEESQKYSIALNMAIESIRDMEEIYEIMNCDVYGEFDARIKFKMISNVIYSKQHYFKPEDVISRQAMFDILLKYNLHESRIAEELEELPPVNSQPKWIPVSKRLPEDYKIVIASVDHKYVYPEARYSKEDGWEWAYESGADYWVEIEGDVDAWMSLPKPYKPESEDKND